MASMKQSLQAERIERVVIDVGFEYVRYRWIGPEGNTRGWYFEEDLREMVTQCRETAELPLCPGVAPALLEMADFIEEQLAAANNEEKGGTPEHDQC